MRIACADLLEPSTLTMSSSRHCAANTARRAIPVAGTASQLLASFRWKLPGLSGAVEVTDWASSVSQPVYSWRNDDVRVHEPPPLPHDCCRERSWRRRARPGSPWPAELVGPVT